MTSLGPSQTPGYQCLFCGEGIEPSGLDPCALHLVARFDRPRGEQKEQTFFCHLSCIRAKTLALPDSFYIADPDFPTVSETES